MVATTKGSLKELKHSKQLCPVLADLKSSLVLETISVAATALKLKNFAAKAVTWDEINFYVKSLL